jgi:protein gp37
MGENSAISWTDHTFNPWIGCTKVSPGCANCYAEAYDKRWGGEHWGNGAPRQRTSEANWRKPLKWNREASGPLQSFQEVRTMDGRTFRGTIEQMAALNLAMDDVIYAGPARPRVFCASLADWLDDEVPIKWLADLLDLIRRTPNLDWLLLTKRPENWYRRVSLVDGEMAESWIDCIDMPERGVIPQNVWIGTTVEDQQRADERIPQLIQIPAKVRFLSCEPLLEMVDLSYRCFGGSDSFGLIHWVICGGESGPQARPMPIEWARDLRIQSMRARVPFFMKQLGGAHDKRSDIDDLPPDLRLREFPDAATTTIP